MITRTTLVGEEHLDDIITGVQDISIDYSFRATRASVPDTGVDGSNVASEQETHGTDLLEGRGFINRRKGPFKMTPRRKPEVGRSSDNGPGHIYKL